VKAKVRNESEWEGEEGVVMARPFSHLLTNMWHWVYCFDRYSCCLDPKGGDLLLVRMKPSEMKVEVRQGADVQIAPRSWQMGRKTNRIVVVAGSSRSFPQDSNGWERVWSGKEM